MGKVKTTSIWDVSFTAGFGLVGFGLWGVTGAGIGLIASCVLVVMIVLWAN